MLNERRRTRKIQVGNIFVGGDSKITVQSMTNTDSSDFDSTYAQIKRLQDAGCEIVRITVPDENAVRTVVKLKESDINIPIVADIHFDYKMAVMSAEAGADKIRINPGNIGGDDRVKAVVDACRKRNVPIRIGVNSGSLENNILAKYGSPCGEALAESALYHASLLEKYDFYDIILSVKSSRVAEMIKANTILAEMCDYPLHLGVTEAGTLHKGLIKSSAGIGSLLLNGIGDTIRVSLTDDPVQEVVEGRAILSALGIEENSGINVISCPTCGRTKIDLIGIVNEFERRIGEIKCNRKIDVAIMGCVVNGPGEAKECDIGIAGGVGEAVLFKKGEVVRKISEEKIIDELIEEINRL